MHFWTFERFATITAGRWLVEPGDLRGKIAGVSIDSRTLRQGEAFIAIRGDRFDGHAFVDAARDRDAALAVVDRESDEATKRRSDEGTDSTRRLAGAAKLPMLWVPDTLIALQQLASAYRDELAGTNCRVIAVAGSNGKTTTRSLIHTALATRWSGTQSPKSFNNHIGVPLTLLAAPLQAAPSFVVVEVGTNHPGEIDALGRIVRPDVAVITSIGHEHLEFFGSVEAVAREECAILHHVRPNGCIIIPGDDATSRLIDPHLAAMPAGVTKLRFGRSERCDVALADVDADPTGQTLRVRVSGSRPITLHLPLLGLHNASNALAALAVARGVEIDVSKAANGLAEVRPMPMRLDLGRIMLAGGGEATLINDAYNANFDSMRAALEVLESMPTGDGGRRIAVLGDMLELGALGPDLHRQIGQWIGRDGGRIDHVVLIGKLAMFIAEPLARHWPADRVTVVPEWRDDLPQTLRDTLRPGDVVLLKASRSMRLERIADV